MPTGGAGYTLLVSLVPATDDLVDAIQQIDVECTLDQASVLSIRLGTTATEIGDWTILELDPFRPLTPLQLRLQAGIGAPEALINAFLTEHEGTTIQRGTDIRFLRRLAQRNGFDCYVQPEPLSGLDFGHFHARQLT